MNLRAKLGPLPRWAWLLIAAGAGYLLYRHFRAGTATGVQSQMTTVPLTSASAGVSGSDLGLATSAGSPADGGSSTSDLLAAYSASQAGLLSAFADTNSDIVSLAQSQIAAAQQTGLGSFQTETQALTSPMPGGSNSPTVIYVQPSLKGGVSSPPSATVAKVKSAKTTPDRFYTYAKLVPLKHGQSVKYRAGRGYYAG